MVSLIHVMQHDVVPNIASPFDSKRGYQHVLALSFAALRQQTLALHDFYHLTVFAHTLTDPKIWALGQSVSTNLEGSASQYVCQHCRL
jgi:hypothetical protein